MTQQGMSDTVAWQCLDGDCVSIVTDLTLSGGGLVGWCCSSTSSAGDMTAAEGALSLPAGARPVCEV